MKRQFLFPAAFLILTCGILAQALHGQSESLGDVARRVRDNKRPQVQVSASDTKELFAAVDEITLFASRSSGLPKRGPIKREMLSLEQLERKIADLMKDQTELNRMMRSEAVMKKFGLFPATFDYKAFMTKTSAESMAAFYEPKTKTVFLLNWIDFQEQRSVMAHELTHALQDQNLNLDRFAGMEKKPADEKAHLWVAANDQSELTTARRAVIEGQAELVHLEYLLKPSKVTLDDAPQYVLNNMVNAITDYSSPVIFHNGPRVLREIGTFPYREGVAFELELFRKGGRAKAFSDVLTRPPTSTFEILDPDAYLKKQKVPFVALPDIASLLGGAYRPYDSGGVGQLDVRIMAREFGIENDTYRIGPNWDGGAYVAAVRTTVGADAIATPADLALLYVSRWKTPEEAEHFAKLYLRGLQKRLTIERQDSMVPSCKGERTCDEPTWATRLITNEGPVFLEVWPGNVLIITQSFEEDLVPKLVSVALTAARTPAGKPGPKRDLGAILYESNTFVAMQEELGRQVRKALSSGVKP